MVRFLTVRLSLIAVTLLVVSLAIFTITEILPGDVATMMLRQGATEQNLKRVREDLGLDRPAYVRYLSWIGGVAQGDLGDSYFQKRPIVDITRGRLGNSVILAVFAFLVAVPSAVAAGIWAGVRPDTLGDRIVSVTSLVGISLPEFVTGVLLIVVFSSTLDLFPSTSIVLPGTNPLTRPYILVLPTLTLTGVLFAYVMRMTRANVIEVMQTRYVRAAILKGLPMRRVIFRHVVPNAMLPTITIIAQNFGWLLGGLIIVETVFCLSRAGTAGAEIDPDSRRPLVAGPCAPRRRDLCHKQPGGGSELRRSRPADQAGVMAVLVTTGKTRTGVTRAVGAAVGPVGRGVRSFLRLALAATAGRIGLPLLAIHLTLALVGPWLAPYSPTEFHLLPDYPEEHRLSAPTSLYWLGTDQFGRDLLSRMMSGARSLITMAVGGAALGVALGTVVGMSSGYKGGRVDEVVMRVMDGLMSFPSLLLALLVLTTLGSKAAPVEWLETLWQELLIVVTISIVLYARGGAGVTECHAVPERDGVRSECSFTG